MEPLHLNQGEYPPPRTSTVKGGQGMCFPSLANASDRPGIWRDSIGLKSLVLLRFSNIVDNHFPNANDSTRRFAHTEDAHNSQAFWLYLTGKLCCETLTTTCVPSVAKRKGENTICLGMSKVVFRLFLDRFRVVFE